MKIPPTNPFKEIRQRVGLTQLEVVYRCRELDPKTKLRPDRISSFENGQSPLSGAEQTLVAKVLGFSSTAALVSTCQTNDLAEPTTFCPKQFKRLLQEKGFSSAPEFARVLGCNQSTVSNWLSGRSKPTSTYEKPILQALQVERERLWVQNQRLCSLNAGPHSLGGKLRGALTDALRGAKLRVKTNSDWSKFTKSLIRALKQSSQQQY